MTLIHRLAAAGIAIALLGACQAGDPSPTDQPTIAPSPTPVATDAPGADPTGTPGAEPTGGDFTCDLPLVTQPTVAIANIVDVRVGEHDGYDRIVFEFEQGIPEVTLARDEPPFFEDGSGFEVAVDGDAFLALVMRGGTKQTDAGTSSYAGPTEFERDFATLRHLVEGGDFERQSTWYVGLTGEACVSLFVLDDPPRLVLDLEH